MVATALDVVILTVIPRELQAVLNTLALSNRWTGALGTVHYRGTAHSALSGRALQVAATCIGNAGNSAAAAAACNAIAQWKPQAVLLVGIAAGLRDRLRLGSVVLSDRVIAYEHAAVLDRSGSSHQQPRPEGTRLPHMMVQQVASYEPKAARLTERFVRAGLDSIRLGGHGLDVDSKLLRRRYGSEARRAACTSRLSGSPLDARNANDRPAVVAGRDNDQFAAVRDKVDRVGAVPAERPRADEPQCGIVTKVTRTHVAPTYGASRPRAARSRPMPAMLGSIGGVVCSCAAQTAVFLLTTGYI